MPSYPRRVLCFGDSNTWGYSPGSEARRFAPDIRWPGVLQRELGDGYDVIEEAQNGRTTVHDDPMEEICKNGARHLPVVLQSQAPIDLVILMLGTNDLKHYFNQTALSIAHGAGVLVDRILASGAGSGPDSSPQVLLVSPPAVAEGPCCFGPIFEGGPAKSLEFPSAYRAVAEARGIAFLDAAEWATCPVPDTIHLDEAGCQSLGKGIAAKLRELGW